MGNLRSISNKFKKIGVSAAVSAKHADIAAADKLVLPGVGNFNYGMRNLKMLGLIQILNKKVIEDNTQIMGICLGAQLFANHSEEGDCAGLGWIDAEVIKFDVSDKIKYKVPHIGWNNVTIKNSNVLNQDIKPEDQFYFVHSYHLKCNNPADIWMTSTYDYQFVAAIRRDNIIGTQFHPEKSHDVGLDLLKIFTEL